MTGPATAGFQSIKDLDPAKVTMKFKRRSDDKNNYLDIELKNSGKAIAFFTQLQWLDADGKPVRPSYYTDNFFSMLPGETKTVTIETNKNDLPAGTYDLVLKGFNVEKKKNTIEIK